MAYKYVNDNGLKAYTKKVKRALKDLHTPIAISTENTTESKAQNVKNIADYIEKAKAAGVADVNGMAVTCLIDNDYSGVGYLYDSGGDILIQGVLIKDDLVDNMCFNVFNLGDYTQQELITSTSIEAVTPSMLSQGARKPIILTQSTTEVDEETYQKLLSDDVDVMFKASDGNYCVLTYKYYNNYDNKAEWEFYFTCFSCEDSDMDGIYIYAYRVSIVKNTPHTCNITELYNAATFRDLVDMAGYPNKCTLSLVLQEIDLTGTDAERKANLAQFEADWKYLTGENDLSGARFVGLYIGEDTNSRKALFIPVFGQNEITAFEGISTSSDRGYSVGSVYMNEKVFVDTINGSIKVTPLFSHLEAIVIKTSNSTKDKADNNTALNSYIDNLIALGLSDAIGIMLPIWLNNSNDYGILIGDEHTGRFKGFAYYNNAPVEISISSNGAVTITSTINEVNTLAQAVKAFGAIELKASDNAANKAALAAYLKILTDAGVSTTNGYSVPVRITGNAQEYHGMLNIGTGALLSGIVTDVNENHHYPFNISTADGAITFDANNYFLEKTSNEVTEMLDAIKYSYTPVPLTATTLSNKAQLEVFLSKVPTAQVMHCTYKDVYVGTLHKINGEWFGLLVKNTNNYEDALQVKLQADGTLIEGTTSLAQVNAKLDTIIG